MPELNDTCFLCRQPGKATQEHVFPKWLQKRFNLWDERIALKNGTSIRYRELKIPCCAPCNNMHFSRIESQIGKRVAEGDGEGLRNSPDDAFVWLYKLMYGTHYKEQFLRADRSDQESRTIVTTESIDQRASYVMFPMFAAGLVKFSGFSPYSLLVFRINPSTPIPYFYASEPYAMWAATLTGRIGMIASFQDDGYIARDIHRANVTHASPK